MTSFETAATVLGALLVGGALLSGLARRSFLSLTAVFVLVGVLLGSDGLDVLKIDPRSSFVRDLAITALVLILFRDGLEVDAEMLQRAWHLPLRKLVLAMPITAVIIAVAAKVLIGLTWTRGVPRRRAAVAHRSGAVLQRGQQPARAARHPPLAQPGVRAQRRPGAACGPGLHRGAGVRQRLRVVEVPPAGREPRRGLRAGHRVPRLARAAARARPRTLDGGPPARALRARRRLPDLRPDDAAPTRQRRDRRLRVRHRPGHPPPGHPEVLRRCPATSSRSSSSACSSSSARC